MINVVSYSEEYVDLLYIVHQSGRVMLQFSIQFYVDTSKTHVFLHIGSGKVFSDVFKKWHMIFLGIICAEIIKFANFGAKF